MKSDTSTKSIIVIASVMVLIAVIALGIPAFREKIVQPVLEDATGGIGGYNPISTAIYSAEISLSALLVYEILEKLNFKLRLRHLFMILPYVVLAAILRVSEDVGVNFPFVFISPLIQIFILTIFLLSVVLAIIIREKTLREIVFSIYALVLVFFLWWALGGTPLILTSLVMIPLYHFLRSRESFVILLGSIGVIAGLIYIITRFYGIFPIDRSVIIPVLAFLIISTSAAVLVGVILNVGSILIILGSASQALDGIVTYLAVTSFGYVEKHVISKIILGYNPSIYLSIKLFIGLVVGTLSQYLVSLGHKKGDRTLNNIGYLISIYVLSLGIGPGLRDLLRLILQV